MPHSSGGGSHSGGSSGSSGGSSFGSSSSSSSSSYHTSTTYFSGAYKYVKYHDGKADCVYSENPNLNSKGPGPIKYLILLIYIPFIVSGLGIMGQSASMPRRINTYYAEPVTVKDDIDVINDEDALKETLYEFYAKTGVPVTIMTKDNEEWKPHYNALEYYAYDLYVNTYKDEDHWLIVYSSDGSVFNDWYFEGMQGDNTDKVLTKEITGKFNANLYKYLLNRNYSVDNAFIKAFGDIYPDLMKFKINKGSLGFCIVWFGFIGGHMCLMLRGLSRKNIYEDYVKIPEGPKEQSKDSLELRCEYCNGIYYKGTVTSCPHCGAPVAESNKKSSVS